MDGLGSADFLLFEGFRSDRRTGSLSGLDQGGNAVPVAFGGRALDLAETNAYVPSNCVLAAADDEGGIRCSKQTKKSGAA
jgi:hypothetical protein